MILLRITFLVLGTGLVGAAVPAPVPQPVTVVVSSQVSTTSTVKLFFYNSREAFLKSGKWA